MPRSALAGAACASPSRSTTSTTPSTFHISRTATGIRSPCGPAFGSSVPLSVTIPLRTDTSASPGFASKIWSSTRRMSVAMSASVRRNTLIRSRRLTMPTSLPSSSVTGSLPTWCAVISRAAAETVASGPIVTAGDVINSPAVSAGCREPPRRQDLRADDRSRPAALACPRSRSASVTTPTTSWPIFSTGRPLIRCSANTRATSLYGVIRSTVSIVVVITSLTRRDQPWGRWPPSASRPTRCGRSGCAALRRPPAPVSLSPSSTVSRARATSAPVALPCNDS